eukprot:g27405.t1
MGKLGYKLHKAPGRNNVASCTQPYITVSKDPRRCPPSPRSKSHDASPIALSYPFYQDWAPQMPDVSECKQPRFPPPGSATYPKQVYDSWAARVHMCGKVVSVCQIGVVKIRAARPPSAQTDSQQRRMLQRFAQAPRASQRSAATACAPIETRLVRCRVEGMVQGDVSFVRDDACVAPKPVTSRVVRAIQDSGVPREALFLAGKLSAADHYPLGALRAVQQQMKHLDLTYLDLFMLTKPIYDPAVLRAVWEILESYHHRGIFRSLGVSNFDLVSLELLEQVAKVPPVYLQNRFSLYDVQGFEALAWAKRRGLAMAARLEQSLLSPWEELTDIARRWNRSSQELLSRWLLQLGCAIVAPASAAEDHAGALSFQMPEEDMRQLGGLISLSSSVPGVGPPSWMEDVYGLARFGPPAVLGVTDAAPVPELHGFSKPFAYRAPVAKENGRPARRLRGSRGVATKARKAFLGPRFRCRLEVWQGGELAETRGVQCEGAEAAPLPQSRCTGLKPLERRVICPATPPCETSAAAPATTLAPTTTLAPMTTSATLPATEAAKAEALARADAGKLLLLFGGALATGQLHLSAEAPQKSIAFRAPVASMAKAHDHGRVVVTLHATTEEAPRCAALVLSIAEDGTCRVVHETSLPGQRLFLSTALSTEKTAKVVAYRPVREASQSYIELLAVQMELAELELSPEAKILWTARGPHAPPATSTVLCARTSPCGAATVPAVAPTVVPTTAAPVTTQAGPSPVWAYVEWTVDSTNCSARSCGLGAVVQERAVLCNDLVTGQQLADSSCLGLKPPTKRTICPATAPCVKVEITDAWTCCPRGYALKKPEDLPTTCQQGSCEVESCCSMVSWVNLDWDETQACSQSCGLPQQMQERSVTCQAMYSGEVAINELRDGLKALTTELRNGAGSSGAKLKGKSSSMNASFVSTSIPIGKDLDAWRATPGSVLADPANEIVAHVWPQVSHWATEFLLKEVGPAIHSALPESLSGGIDPDRCHLGHEAVKFSSIKIFEPWQRNTRQRQRKNGISGWEGCETANLEQEGESEEKKPCFSRFLKQIKVEKSAEVVQHATGRTLDLRDPDMLQRFTSVRRVRIRQQACQESKWNAALAGISEEIAQSSGMRRWQLRIEYGQLLRRAGLFEEAMTEVSEVHKAFPTSIEVLMEFAQILSKLGRVEHITDLEAHVRSICCDPEDVRLEMELILRLGRLKAEAVEVTETPIDVREPRIEGYAIWSLRDVTLVSKHSAIYHFVSKDRQRGTPNPRGRGRTVWPKTWHVTLLARLGANSEGPLPWIERDYTPISTAKEWEQGQCDILIKIYNDGQATSWLQQQPLGIRIWFSQPVKTLSVPSLLPDLDQAPFRPASYLLLLAGTGIVAAAQVLHHAERGKCFGSSPTINSPIRLVHSCRSDDVLMSFELLDWCTKGLLKSWTLLLTEAEAGMTPFPDVQDADLTNCMEWHGDPSIFLQLAGQEGGVHGIMLRGQLLVELVHMLPYPPMFKGVRLFFLDPPELQNVSLIQRKILDVVQGQLASRVVAPKFMGFKMVNTDIFQITSPAAEGILRVTVWSANDLLPMDTSFFGKGTSDPYVKVRCGAHVLKSETFWKTLCPQFGFKASLPISSLAEP